ncbi:MULTISPECIES: nitroreductase family protein [unclassified Pseudonocardia]|uniref:Acg family FMN-binding oxidoreductase n=1 Tax=unclassified Pseudonocardia TaxID=2619320 RepID=UPI0009F95660|nr:MULTISPECIES: nitroreductase family protein [unclassified Pseudonocardia]
MTRPGVPGPTPPRPGVVRQAVATALMAPSVHNSQPWRWRIGADRIELYGDPDRRLPFTDPDGRDLLVSCGSALSHLHVALAAADVGHETLRFPTDDRHHLATVRLTGGPPDLAARADRVLAPAIAVRRSDRRPFTDGELAPHTRAALGLRAARYGVALHAVTGTAAREQLAELEREAARDARRRPGQAAELLVWTHRYAGSRDGVRASSVPAGTLRTAGDDLAVRFPPGSLPVDPLAHDRATILVLSTPADDDEARLAAGEAGGALLLAATRAGLATCPLTRILETRATRAALASRVLRTPDHAQLLIRIGRAPDDRELPATPRRRLSDVLVHGHP